MGWLEPAPALLLTRPQFDALVVGLPWQRLPELGVISRARAQRVGEDVSEKLDIVPPRIFVHRHIYGKWACRCCQLFTQEPAEHVWSMAASPPAVWWRTRRSAASRTICRTTGKRP